MEADPKAAGPNPEDESPSRRRGIGLCLSGGGFRATLFHLGAIRRLFELGITARPGGRSTAGAADAMGPREAPLDMRAVGFDTIASVSGGSIASAQWAIALNRAKAESRSVDFDRDIARPLQALTARDIRTGAMARKLFFPWNWFRGSYAVDALISKFEAVFGKDALDLLPEHPRFVLCGTDMSFGANFVFEKGRVGSYLAGYAPANEFTLAQAVAASACFPPLFGPLRIDRAAERFKGGYGPTKADERRKILSDLRVTDGGVYDNMGLEPVWKSHRVVLVSDAGGLMDAEADKNLVWRVRRYQSIQEAQARGVRKRFLIAGYVQGSIGGAYIGVGGAADRYRGAKNSGYSKAFAMEVIANIRTDLDAFSEVERGVLENHGYALMDAAIRTHAPDLIATEAAFAAPFPAFASPAMGEDELRRALLGSEKRKPLGRG